MTDCISDQVVSILRGVGFSERAIQTWMTNPTSYRSAEIPEIVMLTDPDRALRAAKYFAASSSA